MAVPKRKKSKSRKGMRRAHLALKANSLSTCANCKETKMPHRICPHCGYYKGQEIITMAS